MKILSMNATFGKLEHETLTFTPGLNVIEAPNEWGKTTWCAFLVSMLYGMETRAKSTKTALADKERYLPWSGSPMAGSIDIDWNGRKITIQRKTKGRVPLGDFKAFETDTGLAVPELNAANCGEMLLGVEKSVFLRSSFIRHSDLPVGQDEALRRRLNALVTTGDESGDAEKLAKALKDLKNRCRYNRTGLLPQAEQQRQALENTLREQESLSAQSEGYSQRLSQLKDQAANLENHRQALAYEKSKHDQLQVARAEQAAQAAKLELAQAQAACVSLPPREEIQASLAHLDKLLQNRQDLLLQQQMCPPAPVPPQPCKGFSGTDGDAALAEAQADAAQYRNLNYRKPFGFLAAAALVILGCLLCPKLLIAGILAIAAGACLGIFAIVGRNRQNQAMAILSQRYGNSDPDAWVASAAQYREAQQEFKKNDLVYRENQENFRRRIEALDADIRSAAGDSVPTRCRESWLLALSRWDRLAEALRESEQTQLHAEALGAMAKPTPPPAHPDELTFTEAETVRRISDTQAQIQLLSNRLSQNQGRMEALGDPEALKRELDKVNRRIQKLEDVYAALTIAQETLSDAALELQRKFAPKIAAHAQELLREMTGGRYRQLLLREDLTLETAAGQEQTLHDALWRSDGTADQMYLALRLAVAQALTPDAPLVLDDAMVRFDDNRLRAALAILQKEAKNKQILLFTCQSRENQLISEFE